VTVIASAGLHQASCQPSVDVIEAVGVELENPGSLVVGHMQHQTHVRIRDTDLIYAALQNERCFEVVLGGRRGVAAKVLLPVPPISAGRCPFPGGQHRALDRLR
jgi:hypothetical protein